MMHYRRVTTPEVISKIKSFLEAGMSYSDIAIAMKMTRCQIAGIKHRYINGHFQRKEKPKVEKQTVDRVINLNKKTRKLPIEKPIIHKPAKFPDERFMANGYCRAIIGEPRELTACALPSEGSWCAEHRGQYFNNGWTKKQ
jgi:hypothetical protein